ncbi:hypothetical protein [Streptomyces sp. NPDC056323]|uniref:hypothetical protein n=1 Tax=Streptomyces sp. NPDC056323 TaxID=3345784 RepID=UPI0035DF8499
MAEPTLTVNGSKAEITLSEAEEIEIEVEAGGGHVEQRVRLQGDKLDLQLAGFRGSLVKFKQDQYSRGTQIDYSRPESGSLQLGQPGDDLYLKVTGEGRVESGRKFITGPCTLTVTLDHAIGDDVQPNKVEGKGPVKYEGNYGAVSYSVTLSSQDGKDSGSRVEITWSEPRA